MNASRWFGTALILIFGGLVLGRADDPVKVAQPAQQQAKDIDLVICLDCSNSMDGLIDSAKAKLWDIVNDFNKIKAPRPNLRVGLYSYGNDGYDATVGWVRKEVDLTSDLDLVYQKLFALKTNGGTEYVTRVCRDAVRDLKWTQQAGALKLVFVCGNEPASQDPIVSLKQAAEFALSKGIYINPVYCGDANDSDARDWKQFAGLSGGQFATIDQNAAKVAVATPMDKDLAELGVKLTDTYVYYGESGDAKKETQITVTKRATGISASAGASCAVFRGSALYKTADWDLVERCKADPKFDVGKLPANQLCESMRKMTPEERLTHVKDMAGKRAAIQKEIAELESKRQTFIAAELKRDAETRAKNAPAAAAPPPLEKALTDSIRKQAEKKGFAY